MQQYFPNISAPPRRSGLRRFMDLFGVKSKKEPPVDLSDLPPACRRCLMKKFCAKMRKLDEEISGMGN